MKRIAIISAVFVLLALANVCYAHPPQKIEITFDQQTNTLTAVITHKVSNPEKHYINKVDIAVNGQEVSEETFQKQDNAKTQTAVVVVKDAKPGDTLSVEAYCNLSGKRTEKIKVE